MSDFRNLLAGLKRPRLLIRAARHGLAEYRRDRDLHRLIGGAKVPAPDEALRRLMHEEARLEGIRGTGDAAYSLVRHIEVLIALMAEARLLPRDLQV
jgi:plasmid stability protein